MERKPFYAAASPFGGGTDSARAQGPPLSPARASTDIPSPGTLWTPSPGSGGPRRSPRCHQVATLDRASSCPLGGSRQLELPSRGLGDSGDEEGAAKGRGAVRMLGVPCSPRWGCQPCVISSRAAVMPSQSALEQ